MKLMYIIKLLNEISYTHYEQKYILGHEIFMLQHSLFFFSFLSKWKKMELIKLRNE